MLIKLWKTILVTSALLVVPASSEPGNDDGRDAGDLCDKLEQRLLPLFHEQHVAWIRGRQQSTALNASFLNTHRMGRYCRVHSYALGDEA